MIKPVPHYQHSFYTKQTKAAIRITPQLQNRQAGGLRAFFWKFDRRPSQIFGHMVRIGGKFKGRKNSMSPPPRRSRAAPGAG